MKIYIERQQYHMRYNKKGLIPHSCALCSIYMDGSLGCNQYKIRKGTKSIVIIVCDNCANLLGKLVNFINLVEGI